MKEKKFTKTFLLTFAHHCMAKLLQTPAEETNSGMAEISGYDLSRIFKVLSEYK